MFHRRHFLVLAVGLLGVMGCSEKSSPTSRAPVLRVGMDLSYPPFEMQDASGRPDGVSVRLAEALAAPAQRAYDRGDIDSQTYLTLTQTRLARRADLDDRELVARLAQIQLETMLFLPPTPAGAAP